MGFTKSVIAACILCAASVQVSAQVDNLPRKNVNGASYFYYEVQPKETVYSISRKLGISSAEIQRLNPSVADGLKAGQVLYFPVGVMFWRVPILSRTRRLCMASANYTVCQRPNSLNGIRRRKMAYAPGRPFMSARPKQSLPCRSLPKMQLRPQDVHIQ